MTSNTSMLKFLLNLSLVALLAAFAIAIKNRETLKWFFSDVNNFHKTIGVIKSSNTYHTGVRGGWSFSITYEYFVDEAKFESSRVHFGYQTSSDVSYAQGFVNKYPVGKEVEVYYNPNDPSEAVLEPEIKWFGLLYYIGGYILLSVVLFFSSVYHTRKSK